MNNKYLENKPHKVILVIKHKYIHFRTSHYHVMLEASPYNKLLYVVF